MGPFFATSYMDALSVPVVEDWQSTARIFSRWVMPLGDAPPDWLANPLTGQRISEPQRPWWQFPDFDPAVGDIKLVWELSRMDWVLALAQRVRQGDAVALERLNIWLADWCKHNPPYLGPNWKCGQEASIRVMHLACAALLLGQVREALPGLRDLVVLHLKRIAPTVQYAMAQDNNHGTSEAAALFIGGSWLAALGHKDGTRWESSGRRWLENRVGRLIGPQGSFSQYSLNYHRVMLDTLSIAEVWRKQLVLPAFSKALYERVGAAGQWLRHMTNPVNGDGPNVGANDGARLLQLTDSEYRDHRPSVQLAMVLFLGQRAYSKAGPWDDALAWLGIPLSKEVATPLPHLVADDGGFAVLRRGPAMAMLRYPRFRYRPSHADALHLDLWLGGENLLRDAGTYSYNTEPQWLAYFPGTASHNTVQFDDRDQMPRIGRFLFGDWLRTEGLPGLMEDEFGVHIGASYKDAHGGRHHRAIQLDDGMMRVKDEISGFERKAVLRWRLSPDDWILERDVDMPRLIKVRNSKQTLTVHTNVPIVRCELGNGWESRHYLEKTSLPVLEIEVHESCKIVTEIRW